MTREEFEKLLNKASFIAQFNKAIDDIEGKPQPDSNEDEYEDQTK